MSIIEKMIPDFIIQEKQSCIHCKVQHPTRRMRQKGEDAIGTSPAWKERICINCNKKFCTYSYQINELCFQCEYPNLSLPDWIMPGQLVYAKYYPKLWMRIYGCNSDFVFGLLKDTNNVYNYWINKKHGMITQNFSKDWAPYYSRDEIIETKYEFEFVND